MWKKISIFSLIVIGMAGFSHTPAQGATVLVKDSQNEIYRVSRSSINQAYVDSLEYCASYGNGGCSVISVNAHSGFGAVAQSGGSYGTATGFSTQEEASRTALNACARQIPADRYCRVTLKFFDSTGSR